jgi:hypothetical protein
MQPADFGGGEDWCEMPKIISIAERAGFAYLSLVNNSGAQLNEKNRLRQGVKHGAESRPAAWRFAR